MAVRQFPKAIQKFIEQKGDVLFPAFIQFTCDYELVKAGGSLAHYQIHELSKNSRVDKQLPLLEGFVGYRSGTDLPYIEVHGGVYANIYVFSSSCAVTQQTLINVVLLDVTEDALKRRRMQQRRLSLELATELGKSPKQMEAILSDRVLSELGIATFEQQENGVLTLLGDIPYWLKKIAPSFIEERVCLVDGHETLETFAKSADQFWQENSASVLRSHPWYEPNFEDILLQATAVNAEGRKLFLIQQLEINEDFASDSLHTLYSTRARNSATAAQLYREKERLLTTLQSIGDGVITTNSAGEIDFINPIAETLTGWQLEQAKGKPIEKILRIVHESDLTPVLNPILVAIKEKRVTSIPHDSILLSRSGENYAIQDSAAPIIDGNGDVLGGVLVFQNVSKERGLSQQLAYQASHDSLTGLLNRRSFEQRLQLAIDEHSLNTVADVALYLDLDNFKVINDSAGHKAGDALLKEVGAILTQCLRTDDTISRLGGDEFGLLLKHCPMAKVEEIAKDLIERIKQYNFIWNKVAYGLGVGIGIVALDDEDIDVSQIMSALDVACYEAKARGRNQLEIYGKENKLTKKRHQDLVQAASIRQAILNRQFILYAQPIVNTTDTESLSHYEILVRLQRNGEILTPNFFINAAEQYDLILNIDRFVTEHTFKFAAQQAPLRKLKFNINLSGRSLDNDQFLDHVLICAEKYAIDPGNICFEITETAAIRHLDKSVAFLNQLKTIGFKLALDDFGTGLSSLSYLKQFPIDYIKIDGIFIRNIAEDDTQKLLVQSIHRIAEAMNLYTVAEQVEDDASLAALQKLGVNYVQGYLFGRPVPLSEI